jgi:gelsolin
MIDKEKIKIEDTNMANFGTELETNIKKASAMGEKQWEGIGKEPGINIWRIEKFQVVPWPKNEYGSFFNGDTYLILNTYKKTGSDSLCWNAHMWVGIFTTKDEAGTAAYKIVELDTLFNGEMVLFREVQGNESELFQSYFPRGVNILDGGIESGFRKISSDKYKTRLLIIKGNKNLRVSEVELKFSSLNKGKGLNPQVLRNIKLNVSRRISKKIEQMCL